MTASAFEIFDFNSAIRLAVSLPCQSRRALAINAHYLFLVATMLVFTLVCRAELFTMRCSSMFVRPEFSQLASRRLVAVAPNSSRRLAASTPCCGATLARAGRHEISPQHPPPATALPAKCVKRRRHMNWSQPHVADDEDAVLLAGDGQNLRAREADKVFDCMVIM